MSTDVRKLVAESTNILNKTGSGITSSLETVSKSVIQTNNSMFDGLNIGNNVSDITDKTKSIVSGLKDQLVSPVSTTSKALTEGAALLRRGDTVVTDAISNFSSSVYQNINNLVGALSGGKLNSNELKNFISFKDGKPVLNKRAFISKINRELGFDIENIDGFTDKLVRQMYNKYNAATGGLLGEITDINGKKITFSGDFGDSFGFDSLSFLSKYDKNWREVTDNRLVNTFYDTTFDYVTKAGLTDGYETVFNKYSDKEDAKIALISCVGNIIYNGDVEGLIKACQLVRGHGSPEVFGVSGEASGLDGVSVIATNYPTLIPKFLSKFRIKVTDKNKSKVIFKDQITGIFKILFGEKWYMTTVLGDIEAYDLSKIVGISSDSIKILSQVEELIPLLVTKNVARDVLATKQFKQHFPNTPILK